MPGETSWLESQMALTYAPDPWCSFIYAGVAARTAYVLRQLDASRAPEYEQSALKAMNWAETEYAKWLKGPDYPKVREHAKTEVARERNLAAVELSSLEALPCYDAVSHLMYAAGREHVTHVWVAGEPQVIETAKAGFTMGGGQTLNIALPNPGKFAYIGSRSIKLINQYVMNRADPVPGIPTTLDTIDVRRPDQRYYEENARELLDSPGEWYLDRQTGVLAYWPLAGEYGERMPQIAHEVG